MASPSSLRRLSFLALVCAVAGASAPLGAGQLLGDGKNLLVKDGSRYVLTSDGADVAVVPPVNTEIEAVFSLDRKALVSGVTRANAGGSVETELFLGLADSGQLTALPVPPGRRAGESREQATPDVDARGTQVDRHHRDAGS